MLAIQRNNNKKGFTLAELLVVVAIIAVLVAVSIPIFTAKLEKSREATDIANMRAAKAAATVTLLDDAAVTGNYYYDAQNGKMVDATAAKALTAYGKGTTKDAKTSYSGYTATTDYTTMIIKAAINTTDDTVTISWVTPANAN